MNTSLWQVLQRVRLVVPSERDRDSTTSFAHRLPSSITSLDLVCDGEPMVVDGDVQVAVQLVDTDTDADQIRSPALRPVVSRTSTGRKIQNNTSTTSSVQIPYI